MNHPEAAKPMAPTRIGVSGPSGYRVYMISSQQVLELIIRRDRPELIDLLGYARTSDTVDSMREGDLLWRGRIAAALERADMVIADSRLTPSYGEYVLRFDCKPVVR